MKVPVEPALKICHNLSYFAGEFRSWDLETGNRSLEFGIWNLQFGI